MITNSLSRLPPSLRASRGKQVIKFGNTNNRCRFKTKKTRRQLNSHTKCTVRVSTISTSLLPAVRASAVAPTSKKITFLITSTCPPTMGYYRLYWMKSSSFSVVYNKQPLPRFLALANLFTFLPPVKPLLSHIATAVMIIPYFDDNIAWL